MRLDASGEKVPRRLSTEHLKLSVADGLNNAIWPYEVLGIIILQAEVNSVPDCERVMPL